MGDAAVFAEALMAGYSTRSAIVLKDESASKKDGGEKNRINTEGAEFGHRGHGEE
jgi:hypothetical protein